LEQDTIDAFRNENDIDGDDRATNGELAATLQLSQRFASGCLIGVAYCASLGGAITPIGTGPNLVFFAVFPELFPTASGVSFATWMAFATPISCAIVGVLYLYLAFVHCRGVGRLRLPLETVRRRYAALGALSSGEKRVAALFVAQLLLWLTRGGGANAQFGGWSAWLGAGSAGDGTVAIAIAVLLLSLPAGHVHRAALSSTNDTVALQPISHIALESCSSGSDNDDDDDDEDNRVDTDEHDTISLEAMPDNNEPHISHIQSDDDDRPRVGLLSGSLQTNKLW
jgi:di/tricarboxylate transporter